MSKWTISIGAAFAVALAASTTTVSLAQATSRRTTMDDVTKMRDLTVGLVGQTQVSPPGVSPATAVQYGYLSQLNGLSAYKAEPGGESTALFTFYVDTTTRQVINNGPIRVIHREGTMTIYSDAAANGSFANPNSFRDGTRILAARLRQQVIVNTATGAFTAQNLNTIVSTRAFQGPKRALQLGQTGDRFRTIISGHVASPAAGFMAGYTVSVSEAPKE